MPTPSGQCNRIQPAESSRPVWIYWPEGGVPPSRPAEAAVPQQCVQLPEAEGQQAAVLREFYCALSTY